MNTTAGFIISTIAGTVHGKASQAVEPSEQHALARDKVLQWNL